MIAMMRSAISRSNSQAVRMPHGTSQFSEMMIQKTSSR
jgi:hypothetical protein